jgi:aminocarboxymuconate-semialdehyde decarboxylase
MQIIDSHAHVVIPQILQEFRDGSWTKDIKRKEGTINHRRYSDKLFRETMDVEAILADMKEMRIDKMAISPTPSMLFYELSPEAGLHASQIQNNAIAKLAMDYPNHFAGLAAIPLQEVNLAVVELKRAVQGLGLNGVVIGSSVEGLHLGNPKFLPFWQAVADMDLFVFIHPSFVRSYDIKTMTAYHLHNLFGNPMETGLTAADIVFSGLLERFPGLKILLSHGGGVMPWLIGRWVHGYEVRAEPKSFLKKSPIESIKKLYVDTIIHDPRALRYLVDTFGADHVLLGSDFPAEMGPEFPVDEVERMNFTGDEKEQILGGNAKRLMGLKLA